MGFNFGNFNRKSSPKWFTYPVFGIFFFIVYWLILCPLIFVSICEYYWHYKIKIWSLLWPLYFWLTALFVFIVIMLLVMVLWLCSEQALKKKRKVCDEEKLLTFKGNNDKYYVKNETEHSEPWEPMDIESEKPVQLRNNENRSLYDKRRHTEFPASSKTKLQLKLRPLSHVEEFVDPNLTPREIFFFDLIQAANKSPASHITSTKTFLENERIFSEATATHKNDTEIFIANVPEKCNESNVVFMFIADDSSENKSSDKVPLDVSCDSQQLDTSQQQCCELINDECSDLLSN